MEKTLKWNNTMEVKEFYAGHPFPVNREMETLWYNKILTSNFPTTVFGVELVKKQKLIGITLLKNINLINREAEFAILIGDAAERGKHHSSEATRLTLDFAFGSLGLNRVWLKVTADNQVALKLYKSSGFVKEGLLRESVFKNFRFRNELVMSVLAKDYHQTGKGS